MRGQPQLPDYTARPAHGALWNLKTGRSRVKTSSPKLQKYSTSRRTSTTNHRRTRVKWDTAGELRTRKEQSSSCSSHHRLPAVSPPGKYKYSAPPTLLRELDILLAERERNPEYSHRHRWDTGEPTRFRHEEDTIEEHPRAEQGVFPHITGAGEPFGRVGTSVAGLMRATRGAGLCDLLQIRSLIFDSFTFSQESQPRTQSPAQARRSGIYKNTS